MTHREDKGLTWCFTASLFLSIIFSLSANNLKAAYIYEANQSLIDLTGQSGTTNLNSGDDQVSSAFNLGFTFDFYGESFTQVGWLPMVVYILKLQVHIVMITRLTH